jgi:Ca2+-binding RTX toxin-like protein
MRIPRISVAVVVVCALAFSVTKADTAANTLPASKAEDDSRSITADAMAPIECAALVLLAKVTGTGTITGTNTDELITGSAAVDNIKGQDGDDCILGGDGNDAIAGGKGTDVCIGGPGTDTFNKDCETQIQ